MGQVFDTKVWEDGVIVIVRQRPHMINTLQEFMGFRRPNDATIVTSWEDGITTMTRSWNHVDGDVSSLFLVLHSSDLS